MIGELLALHPPEVVERLTLPQARAILRAVHTERRRQAEFTQRVIEQTLAALVR